MGGEYCQGVWEYTRYNWEIKDLISDGFDLSFYENIEVIGNIYDDAQPIPETVDSF